MEYDTSPPQYPNSPPEFDTAPVHYQHSIPQQTVGNSCVNLSQVRSFDDSQEVTFYIDGIHDAMLNSYYEYPWVSYSLISLLYRYMVPGYRVPASQEPLISPLATILPPPSYFPVFTSKQPSLEPLAMVAKIGYNSHPPDDNMVMEGEPTTISPSRNEKAQEPLPKSRRVQKQQQWESIKDEVHQLYVIEQKTLEATMEELQKKYCFKASLRKWKMQVKQWNFDKYLSKRDMALLVAKAGKRARDEGKETKFYCRGQEINSQKFVNFKKRKLDMPTDVPSPSAVTPIHITYDTPRYENDLPGIDEEEVMTTAEEMDRPSMESITPKPSSTLSLPLETPEKDLTFIANSEWWLSKKEDGQLELEQLKLWMHLANYCLEQGTLNACEKAVLAAMLRFLRSTATDCSTPRKESSSIEILNLRPLFDVLLVFLRQPRSITLQHSEKTKDVILRKVVSESTTFLQTLQQMLSSHPGLLQGPAHYVVALCQLRTLAYAAKLGLRLWPERSVVPADSSSYEAMLYFLFKAGWFARAGKRNEYKEYLIKADTIIFWLWAENCREDLKDVISSIVREIRQIIWEELYSGIW